MLGCFHGILIPILVLHSVRFPEITDTTLSLLPGVVKNCGLFTVSLGRELLPLPMGTYFLSVCFLAAALIEHHGFSSLWSVRDCCWGLHGAVHYPKISHKWQRSSPTYSNSSLHKVSSRDLTWVDMKVLPLPFLPNHKQNVLTLVEHVGSVREEHSDLFHYKQQTPLAGLREVWIQPLCHRPTLNTFATLQLCGAKWL